MKQEETEKSLLVISSVNGLQNLQILSCGIATTWDLYHTQNGTFLIDNSVWQIFLGFDISSHKAHVTEAAQAKDPTQLCCTTAAFFTP